ncbi:MAG: aminoacyl-tRNA hydrolase [Dehalococcoidia bacterium]
MKLIIGLGNPGTAYARNRHNVGFRCVNHFARLHSIRFDRKQCRARIGTGGAGSQALLLAKPMTFMNLSGASVACLVSRHRVPLADLLVMYDDLDLPLGKIRLRQGGGSGGHRGMNSIIAALRSEEFPRIRIGIGRPRTEAEHFDSDAVINHVLSGFSAEEEAAIKPVIARVSQAIGCFVTEGIEAAMNRYN